MNITLQTERLVLRPFSKYDFAAVHRYGSDTENLNYMLWGPNTDEDTHAFIKRAMETDYHFAVVLKESNQLIGACEIESDTGEIGWILDKDYWKKGYGTEFGRALLQFGFEDLNFNRIIATCDAENTGSYKLMEKIGMRREGMCINKRPPNRLSKREYGDEFLYAILKEEWEVEKEIAYYNALPVTFNGFIDVPALTDGVIHLFCYKKYPANDELKHVPAYHFAVCKAGEQIGQINLRIGYTKGLYFGGQIGYDIDEKHRGNGYAVRACRLVAKVAKEHGMEKLIITNDQTNNASRRVCEKLGAKLVRAARIPEWCEMYKERNQLENIFEWEIV